MEVNVETGLTGFSTLHLEVSLPGLDSFGPEDLAADPGKRLHKLSASSGQAVAGDSQGNEGVLPSIPRPVLQARAVGTGQKSLALRAHWMEAAPRHR